jgi:hypothetical protein
MKNPYTVYNYKPGEILNNGHKCTKPPIEYCYGTMRTGYTYHILWGHTGYEHVNPPEILLSDGSLVRDNHLYLICSDVRAELFITEGFQYLGVGTLHKWDR